MKQLRNVLHLILQNRIPKEIDIENTTTILESLTAVKIIFVG